MTSHSSTKHIVTSLAFLNLALQQLVKHAHCADADGLDERGKIQGAEECVPEAKGHHRGNAAARILQRPACVVHTVLLGCTPWQVVLVSSAVHLTRQITGRKCPLERECV